MIVPSLYREYPISHTLYCIPYIVYPISYTQKNQNFKILQNCITFQKCSNIFQNLNLKNLKFQKFLNFLKFHNISKLNLSKNFQNLKNFKFSKILKICIKYENKNNLNLRKKSNFFKKIQNFHKMHVLSKAWMKYMI